MDDALSRCVGLSAAVTRMRKIHALYFLLLFCAGCSNSPTKVASTPAPESFQVPYKPNIIVILTDQERAARHWPEGWAEKNLPAMTRLKKNGLSFERAYTAACECSPSRAAIMTSEYSPENKVAHTPPLPNLPTFQELMNIGSLLKDKAGYDVVWKGKWHLSFADNGDDKWSEKDIAHLQKEYAVYEWNPPDAGNAIQRRQPTPEGVILNGLSTLGGGYANNDGRYVKGLTKHDPKQTRGFGESVLGYLETIKHTPKEQRKPFCLFISLVNPHDVWVYPDSWEESGYKKDDFAQMGIALPSNYKDNLMTKPSVQFKARDAYNAIAPLKTSQEEIEYVNFYAYLNTLADKHVETILKALDDANLTDSTIIIRTSDHGELGLSHGMREKAYTAYEEMIHVPFVVSNPKMYSSAQTTNAFYCHLDLMPTLAELTGIPSPNSYGKGVSIVPVLINPKDAVQDSILFAYDDIFFLPEDVPGGHIRAIRDGNWKYAVYYSNDGTHYEYEMYNLKNDPDELTNLLHGSVSPEVASQAARLHTKLKEKINETKALKRGIPWPDAW